MLYEVVTLCAIIAAIQAKSSGNYASLSASPKNEFHENVETKSSIRFSKYPPSIGNEVQQEVVDYQEPIVRGYAAQETSQSLHSNVGDYKEYDDSDYNGHPKYKYNYSVNDNHTGDFKSHYEERDGDAVRGEYVVADPDGNIRTVTYTANGKNGFQAVVKTTKNNSPYYQTEAPLANQIQSDYKSYVRPTTPIELQNDYKHDDYKYYGGQSVSKEVDDDYKSYVRPVIPTVGPNDYKYYVKPSFPKEVKDDYKQYVGSTGGSSYIRPSIPKEVENDFQTYVRPTIPNEGQHDNKKYGRPSFLKELEDYKHYVNPTVPTGGPNYLRSSIPKQVENDYKTYIRPTIPTEAHNHYNKPKYNFRPISAEVQNDYKSYVTPRHHNLVSELRYKNRLNHRMSVPEFVADDDDDAQEVSGKFNFNTYKFGKSEGDLGGQTAKNYGFGQKSKDQDGLGSDVVASYAYPNSVFEYPSEFYEQ